MATTALPVAGSVPAPARAVVADVNVNLAALSRRLIDALAAHAAAESHRNACEQRFLDQCPDPPTVLTHAGPLGKLKREWDHWRADGLAMLLADRDSRKHWRAARKLVPVAQAYERKVRAFKRAVGLPAAEAAQRAANDALRDLSAEILDVPAKSPAALALKARVVQWDKPDWWDPIEGRAGIGERLAAQILDAAIAAGELAR